MKKIVIKNDDNIVGIANNFLKTIDGWITLLLMLFFFALGVAILLFDWSFIKISNKEEYGIAAVFYHFSLLYLCGIEPGLPPTKYSMLTPS